MANLENCDRHPERPDHFKPSAPLRPSQLKRLHRLQMIRKSRVSLTPPRRPQLTPLPFPHIQLERQPVPGGHHVTVRSRKKHHLNAMLYINRLNVTGGLVQQLKEKPFRYPYQRRMNHTGRGELLNLRPVGGRRNIPAIATPPSRHMHIPRGNRHA